MATSPHDVPHSVLSKAELPKSRSISWISSRRSVSTARGSIIDSPVEATPQANMQLQPESSTKKRRWRLSKAQPVASSHTGTILHAVPKATGHTSQTTPLSPLEMAMAISPNEEILSNIARSSHTDAMQCQALPQFYSVTPDHLTTSTSENKTRGKNEEKATVIGYWKDGETHWEGSSRIPPGPQDGDAFTAVPVSEAAADTVGQSQGPRRSPKPRIQVIIPDHRLNTAFHGVPFYAALPDRTFSKRLPSSEVISQPSVPENSLDQGLIAPQAAYAPVAQRAEQTVAPEPLYPAEHPSEAAIPQSARKHRSRPSLSGSSSSSYNGYDTEVSSNYSRRTSMTSVQGDLPLEPTHPKSLYRQHGRTTSNTFSIVDPVAAGVFEETTPALSPTTLGRETTIVSSSLDEVPLPSPPRELPNPEELEAAFARVKISSSSAASSVRSSRRRSAGSRRLSFMASPEVLNRATPETNSLKPVPSPTLSETEAELEKQLATIAEGSATSPDDTNEHLHQPQSEVPPAIPRKSSARRASFSSSAALGRFQHTTASMAACSTRPPPPSARLNAKGKGPLTVAVPRNRRSEITAIRGQSIRSKTAATDTTISATAAETVILKIFEALDDFDDLFATAVLDKAFYSVFKRHELHLMRNVLRAISLPAWEYRETCPSWTFEPGADYDGPKPEYIPATYLQCYIRDTCTIAVLKSLVLERCRSLLRPETAAAMESTDPREYSRVNDAFWRIWTFCEIFGCGKGREDDIVGQMDWLKGGLLAHQQSCRATIMSSDSFDLSGVLACAPDYFAKGNAGGLTAQQLYDMTELWNCLSTLIQGIQSRTVQARQYGVFDHTDVRGGDIDGEEAMLEEWVYFLLSHGPSTILHLAIPSSIPDSSVFTLAASKGYMNWTPPPHGSSRSTFLKGALARVYEEKISAAFAQSNRRQQTRGLSQRRSAGHAEIVRQGRPSSAHQEPSMSTQPPISEWDLVMNTLDSTERRAPPLVSRTFAQPTPARPPSHHESLHPALRPAEAPSAAPPSAHPPTLHLWPSHPQPLQPPPAPAPARPVSFYAPSIPQVREEPVSQQHPWQEEIFHGDPGVNSAERAIFRIVEMGFTAEEAKRALRMTDLGDGLRIERAVELLLRR